jgi:hypothetical protein
VNQQPFCETAIAGIECLNGVKQVDLDVFASRPLIPQDPTCHEPTLLHEFGHPNTPDKLAGFSAESLCGLGLNGKLFGRMKDIDGN